MLKELGPSEWFPHLYAVLSVDEAGFGPPSHSVTSGPSRTHSGLAGTDASVPCSQFLKPGSPCGCRGVLGQSGASE